MLRMNQIIETMYTNILTNFNVNFEMITNVNIEENYILYSCIVSTNEIWLNEFVYCGTTHGGVNPYIKCIN